MMIGEDLRTISGDERSELRHSRRWPGLVQRFLAGTGTAQALSRIRLGYLPQAVLLVGEKLQQLQGRGNSPALSLSPFRKNTAHIIDLIGNLG